MTFIILAIVGLLIGFIGGFLLRFRLVFGITYVALLVVVIVLLITRQRFIYDLFGGVLAGLTIIVSLIVGSALGDLWAKRRLRQ